MKKFFLISFLFWGTGFAADPMELISQDACVWGGDILGEIKGCPRYYSGKCKDITAKFSTGKVGGKDVLVVDWEWHFSDLDSLEPGETKSLADVVSLFSYHGKDSLVMVGKTKFVVGSSYGAQNLYVYEIQADCRGYCDGFFGASEENIGSASRRKFQSDFPLEKTYELDFLGKPVSIGIENAVEYSKYLSYAITERENGKNFENFERFLNFYDILVPLARVDCVEDAFLRYLNRKTDICEKLRLCK